MTFRRIALVLVAVLVAVAIMACGSRDRASERSDYRIVTVYAEGTRTFADGTLAIVATGSPSFEVVGPTLQRANRRLQAGLVLRVPRAGVATEAALTMLCVRIRVPKVFVGQTIHPVGVRRNLRYYSREVRRALRSSAGCVVEPLVRPR